MAPFSKRTTIVSLILNVLFFFATAGFFTYSLVQKTAADRNAVLVKKLEEQLEKQQQLTERMRIQADSLAMIALKQARIAEMQRQIAMQKQQEAIEAAKNRK